VTERAEAEPLTCGFCRKSRGEVRTLIAGTGYQYAICDECVGLCAEILAMEHPDWRDATVERLRTAKKPEPPPDSN
jgi:ATP-dependent protease Clp ATPase subunit